MMIIGVDYHPSFQQIAFLIEETGEYDEQRLNHEGGEAERFYRDLKRKGIRVRVGMEATGHSRWFGRLLAELDFDQWIGDRAEIQATRVMNQLQALAMNEGKRWKSKLFSQKGRAEFEKLALGPWASRRRSDLLELLDRLNPSIVELTTAVEQEVNKRPEALRLMTHPGVGPITALAFVLIIGTPERFARGKQIGTYVGMIPIEESSGGKQRLGHISKQGSSLLRYLLVEAAQAAARYNPHWRRRYIRLAIRRHRSIAKVAMGRRMAIRLYWMWRNGCDYSPSFEFGSYAGQLEKRHGGK